MKRILSWGSWLLLGVLVGGLIGLSIRDKADRIEAEVARITEQVALEAQERLAALELARAAELEARARQRVEAPSSWTASMLLAPPPCVLTADPNPPVEAERPAIIAPPRRPQSGIRIPSPDPIFRREPR